MVDAPKVKFAVGSEVSLEPFFKSSFARAFVSTRDSKSLSYEHNANTNTEVPKLNGNNDHNFFSLVEFGNGTIAPDHSVAGKGNANLWKQIETVKPPADNDEMDKLRKQCQSLNEENQRLQDALTASRMPYTQVIDNVVLQTQIETLQWQLKQIDANRQMYRSLMKQVVRFLGRASNSLDILHKKNGLKDKGSNGRASRSLNVQTANDDDSSPNSGVCTSSSSSSSDSSRSSRAKSATQTSPCTTGNREFTWSVLRRNDPVHCTPPRNKSNDLNKTCEVRVYKRPKQLELDPNEVPPEKLSQEALRLMRMVQSLLAVREPDLTSITPVDDTESSPSPVDHDSHHHNEMPVNNSFVNPTARQETASYSCRRNSDHENEVRDPESDGGPCLLKSLSHIAGIDLSLQNLLPGGRTSIDATSLNSGSSKTTEEEDALPNNNVFNNSTIPVHDATTVLTTTSTPNKCTTKIEKKERCSKSKPVASVSSAEDESGFSSLNSFQEVGLPGLQVSPIRGCHTEIGLPEIPLDKARHRRWSSTPVEIRTLLKQHRRNLANTQTTGESLSVWV